MAAIQPQAMHPHPRSAIFLPARLNHPHDRRDKALRKAIQPFHELTKGYIMKKIIITSTAALVASAVLTTSAFACSPGYKRVKIQGNWVCMLDHGGPTNLTANPKPGIDAQIAKKKLKLKRQ